MRDALTRRRKPDKERGFLPPILYQYWLSLLLSLSPSLYSRNLLHVVFLLDDWTETLEAGKHQTGACYFPLVYHSLPWGKPQTFSVQRQDFWTLDWQKGRIYHIYSSLILKSESALIIISSLKIKLIKRLWVFFILLSFFFLLMGIVRRHRKQGWCRHVHKWWVNILYMFKFAISIRQTINSCFKKKSGNCLRNNSTLMP